MLNRNTYSSASHANRAFYFNPEGNMGSGGVPTETNESELLRVPAPEEEPATETETTPASTTH